MKIARKRTKQLYKILEEEKGEIRKKNGEEKDEYQRNRINEVQKNIFEALDVEEPLKFQTKL